MSRSLRLFAKRPRLYPGLVAIDLTADGFSLQWDEEDGITGDLARLIELEIKLKRKVLISPTGPIVALSIDDPFSIVAFLQENFDEVSWEGEFPDSPYEPLGADAIY